MNEGQQGAADAGRGVLAECEVYLGGPGVVVRCRPCHNIGIVLVRDRRGLEKARDLTTVVFDKTGTLTRGEFRVVDIATDESLSASEALRLAAGVERESEHTIAQGIVKTAEEQNLSVPNAERFQAIPGHGVRAVVEGREFSMGGPAMLKCLAVSPVGAVLDAGDRAATRGQAVVYLLTSTSAVAAFAVADAVRSESRDAIQRLHDQTDRGRHADR